MRPVLASLLLAVPATALASADAALCAAGWTEDTSDTYFRTLGDCVEFESWGLLAAHEPTGLPGAPDAVFGPVTFTLYESPNTGRFFEYAANADVIPTVTLYLRKAGGTRHHSEMALHGVRITSVRLAGAGETPVVTVSMVPTSVTWTYWNQAVTGQLIEPPIVTTWQPAP
jgi:type VI protein secretion system component Hcp